MAESSTPSDRRRWRSARWAACFAAVVSAPATAAAQTPYDVTHSTRTYTTFNTGTLHTPVAYGPFTNWDEGAAAIGLPFAFDWYGVDYQTIYVYTNGFVSFSPPPSGAGLLTPPNVVPSTGNPVHNFIGVLWGDLVGGSSPSIRSRVTGAAGSRIVAIQVEGLLASNNPNSAANFQVYLYEGSNQVELLYGRNFGLSSLAAAIENATGTDGANLMASSPTCGASCACSPRLCVSGNFLPDTLITVRPPDVAELNADIIAPNGAFPGTSFQAQVRLRNVGLTGAGAFRYEIRLSSSNTSTAGSTLLRSVDVTSLGPSTTQTSTLTLSLPANTQVGTFFLAVVVDSTQAIAEEVETNNVSFSGPFVTGPDLQGEVTVPPLTGPGETLTVMVDLVSAGAPVTRAVRVDFFLGTAPTRGTNDVPLGSRSLSLPDGFLLSGPVDLTVPTSAPFSPPDYFLLAEIDVGDDVEETDETNNLAVSSSTVEVRGPNLEVPSLSAGRFAFRGVGYPVEVRVRNEGGAAAPDFEVCVVLSDNLLISVTTDVVVGRASPITLPAGEEATLRLAPVIPADLTPGQWYVAAVADCAETVVEEAETDNVNRRNDPIVVRDVAPDFVPLAVTTASASAAGEDLPLSVRVANLGNAAGAVRVRVALSENPGVTAADPVVFDSATPVMLSPPQEASVAGWGRIDSTLPSGRYYVGATVDPTDAVDEILEDNNLLVSGPIDVAGSGLAIVTPPPPNALIGVDYARRFDAVGGTGDYQWSLTWSAASPDGLTFDAATAELSGVPAASAGGAYDFEVTVVSGPLTAVRSYRLIVSPATVPLTIVSSQLPPPVAREPYSVQLIAVGGQPPYTWEALGAVPLGLQVAPDGTLGGEAQVVGGATVEVRVTDSVGSEATGPLTINVLDPAARLTITTADLPDGLAGSDYLAELRAEGGTPPYMWTVEGDVPPGLSLELDQTARLTGTPTVAGTYPVVFDVRDQGGLLDRNAYVLDIIEEGALVILTGQAGEPGLPPGEIDVPYLTQDGMPVRLRAAPADDVTWSLVSGRLPTGLSLRPDGIIEGTPTESGAFALLVLVTNPANDLRRATLALVVREGGPELAPDDCSCRATRVGQTSGFGLTWVAILGLVAIRWGRRRSRR